MNTNLKVDDNRVKLLAQMAGIPEHVVADINDYHLSLWLDAKNLALCVRAEIAGYILTRSIDGGARSDREVTLVTIRNNSVYTPHYHANSDALFIAVDGEATLLGADWQRPLVGGDIVAIPRGTLHGFRLALGKTLTWISIQHPPIRAPDGSEDLHFGDDTLRSFV